MVPRWQLCVEGMSATVLDLQLHLAGVEIEVESDSYGGYNVSEHYFLTKEEAAWLVRALGGSLAICYEQYHWDVDVT
jgi:hypothetical protein